METNNETRWVEDRMAALDPSWQPNLAHGRSLLDAGLARQPRFWAWPALAATAALCAAVVVLPQTRVLAQHLWDRYVLNRVDVVTVDFADLPLHAQVTPGGPPQVAMDLDDVERKAGFRPALPAPGVLPANPAVTVISAMTVEETIHVAALQAALNKAGANDARVPALWEGVQLHATVGPIVNLNYPNEVGILEAKPVELSIPTGFPLESFAEIAFRGIGRSALEARSLAQRFIANPAWMLGIPSDEVANIEQVSLPNGPAMLVEETNNDDGSPGRVTVLRSANDRIYCVLTNSRQLALKIAGALP
jgi:hypothetical protein